MMRPLAFRAYKIVFALILILAMAGLPATNGTLLMSYGARSVGMGGLTMAPGLADGNRVITVPDVLLMPNVAIVTPIGDRSARGLALYGLCARLGDFHIGVAGDADSSRLEYGWTFGEDRVWH